MKQDGMYMRSAAMVDLRTLMDPKVVKSEEADIANQFLQAMQTRVS
jgi:hypothetical protein